MDMEIELWMMWHEYWLEIKMGIWISSKNFRA